MAVDVLSKEDMKEYMNDYMSEAEDHLQNLNDSLLKLEENNEDMEAINQFFRSAHTLKSSSAAMGFQKISDLAHKVEDVLSRLRNEEIVTSSKIMEVLFKSVDGLEFMIGNAVKGKTDEFDTSIIIVNLGKILKLEKGKEEFLVIQEGGGVTGKTGRSGGLKSIKVDVEKLDKLMDLVGELMINKMRLEDVIGKEIKKLKKEGAYELKKQSHIISAIKPSVETLGNIISDLQYQITQSRMVPFDHIFKKFPRMVRDLATTEGKDIDFVIEGGEIELDRTVLDKIGEPIIHLLRNAIDHGIESEDERKKSGKGKAVLKLSARRERSNVLLVIEDDGRGFDPEFIKRVAVERGVVSQGVADGLSLDKILDIPFQPKFSTAKTVTEISGRGVGLDVVKRNVESFNGEVKLETEKGKGSKFILELPLTLAIIQCFVVKVADQIYNIPISNIVRSVEINDQDVMTIGNGEVILFEEDNVPLVRLRELFKLNSEDKKDKGGTVIIVEKLGERVGLMVDEIVEEREVILRLLDKSLKQLKGFAGATILGNGNPALILDIATLV
ncbi:chemotaxis protein CheA [Candidatus Pacearchaeota archaeon]|nr:chemotaxis protein CheA [Candidatus Pacearchaeota archaeon]